MSIVISKDLQNYLKTIETESKDVLIDGYFHVDYVIDAFKKGEENGGQKALEDLKNKFTRASTQMFLYGIDLISRLEEEGFTSEDFYVNPFAFKFQLLLIQKILLTKNLQKNFLKYHLNYKINLKENLE